MIGQAKQRPISKISPVTTTGDVVRISRTDSRSGLSAPGIIRVRSGTITFTGFGVTVSSGFG